MVTGGMVGVGGGTPFKTSSATCQNLYPSLLKLVWRSVARKIEQDYQQLRKELALDHYEGLSWIGWRHHPTLVVMAQAFLPPLRLETLRRKKHWVDPATDAPWDSISAHHLDRGLRIP